MGSYVPNTEAVQKEMLKECGFSDFEELYHDIPEEVRLKEDLHLPEGMPELKVKREMEKLSLKNRVFPTIFRGAGAYRHFIPAIVDEVAGKEAFRTAYTPYQAEISQGVLQSIFEYQTEICDLTGMDASNASVYDGAVAAAEACEMCRSRKRTKILIPETVDPKIRSVVHTYSFGRNVPVCEVREKDGECDPEHLQELLLDPEVSCVLLQQPNYYGILENAEQIEQMVHAAGVKLIMSCNPISLALLRTPGEYGADIAVGEGQPLGLPLSFGGPYLGFMAATSKMMRALPGRIVGETTDSRGQRGFVLTLQAREQHIRREKASSNICSNEALCALRASVYMAAMGPEGMRKAAVSCTSNAHYLQEQLAQSGVRLCYDKPFFHEFVTVCPDARKLLHALEEKGILGGLPLDENRILWCATEMNTKEEMDLVCAVAKEVCGG